MPSTEPLELVPLQEQEVNKKVPSSQRLTKESNSDTSWVGFFVIFAACIMIGILVVVGAVDVLDRFTGSSLREALIKEPLRIATYLFLIAISFFAGVEIKIILKDQNNKELRRAYWLSMIVASMLAYGIFYAHLTLNFLPNESIIFLVIAAITGAFIGWILPGLLKQEPFGTLIYLMLLIILVGFTWLARILGVSTYGWAAFFAMLTYFLRSAVISLQSVVAKRKNKMRQDASDTNQDQVQSTS
jgi:hypothetical protein